MSHSPDPSDQTVDQAAGDDRLDSALAIAFGPDSRTPRPGRSSEAEAIREGLPDRPLPPPVGEPLTPVNLGGSPEVLQRLPARETDAALQLVGEIARGGMGAILRGRDTYLGRDLAVKILLEAHQGNADLARRFVEEAQIMGQLQHPGIAPVYELGVFADRRPYFTMKLVKGQTLATLLTARSSGEPPAEVQGPPADLPRLLTIFSQVCQTLAYAHARGVVHRDIKPSNVMVGPFAEVQVMDWGLAKVLQKDEGRRMKDEPPAPDGSSSSFILHPSSLVTEAGSVLGTPAYMAPEQARGDVHQVDERADVFGLGGILCEILTGQPPFTGTGREAQVKARRADLAEAHARLDACGADADLLALARRCLEADPQRRPRHAGEVARAMTAYERSVTERLHRAELERAAAEARAVEETRTRQVAEAKAAEVRKRQRLTVALAAAVLALIVGGAAAVSWRWQEQTQRDQERMAREHEESVREHDIETALREVRDHQAAGRWTDARAALAKANGRLGDAGPAALREQLDQLARDLAFVTELEIIRLRGSEALRSGGFDPAGRADSYAAAFRRYGLDVLALDVKVATARLRQSAIREELLAALDNWAWSDSHHANHARLWEVADAADDSPWRRKLRAALRKQDRTLLMALARDKDALRQPPALQNALAVVLSGVGLVREPVDFLRQAHRRHPGDFWLNYELGMDVAFFQRPPRPDEGIGFLRAAVALRPNSSAAHNELGAALDQKGDRDGAIAEYRKAIEIEPRWAAPHNNLGNALDVKGDFDGAVAEYRLGLALEPGSARTHFNYGIALTNRGKLDEAATEFRTALTLNRNYTTAHYSLGLVLHRQRDLDGAARQYRRAIALNPAFAEAHCNLGAVLRDQGALAESLAEYRRGHELGSRQQGWPYPSAQWVRELEEFVRLDERLTRVLKEGARPTPAERVALADFCQKPFRRRFATAARLYSEAFKADASLADGPRLPHRYNAACAAAQAGCGQGNDAATLDEEQRARLHAQAREWLRADLAALTKLLADGSPQVRGAVRQALEHWRTDGDFAGVRETAAVQKLPVPEQEAWRKLWADVDALLQKARK